MEEKLKPGSNVVQPTPNVNSIATKDRPPTFIDVMNKNKSNITYLTEKINDLNQLVIIYGGRAINNVTNEESQQKNVLLDFNSISLITEELLFKLDSVITNLKELVTT